MAAAAAAAGVRGRIGDDRGAEPGRHRGAADPDGAGHSGRGGCTTAATSIRVRAPGELGVPAAAGVHLTNLLAFAVAGLGFRPARLVMALPWLTVAGTEYLLFRWWFAVDLGTPARAVPPHPVRAPRFALGVLAATLVGFGLSRPGRDPSRLDRCRRGGPRALVIGRRVGLDAPSPPSGRDRPGRVPSASDGVARARLHAIALLQFMSSATGQVVPTGFRSFRAPGSSLTCKDAIGWTRICLRAAKVRSGTRRGSSAWPYHVSGTRRTACTNEPGRQHHVKTKAQRVRASRVQLVSRVVQSSGFAFSVDISPRSSGSASGTQRET
jgi:hypothetical protein